MHIFTDSTADLPKHLSQKHAIQVVPLYVNMDSLDQSFRDGVDIDQKRLFDLVKETGSLPKTSAPTVGDFIQAFQNSSEGLYIGLSSQLSATVQNAQMALYLSTEKNIEVIDSRNLSSGIGLLVLKAAELRDQGHTSQEIAEQIRETVPKIRTSFIVDTLQYLYMGGRCSALQNLVGTMLRLRPVIEVKADGALGVKAKIRGKRATGLRYLLDCLENDLDQIDLRRIAVTHTSCPEDAEYLATEIRRMASPQEVIINEAGCVISSHCGPRTIGIIYSLK